MAHSLEAAIVLPLALSFLAGLSAQVLPLLRTHELQARKLCIEQMAQLDLQHLYWLDASRNVLLTSPQLTVEWIFLLEDATTLLER